MYRRSTSGFFTCVWIMVSALSIQFAPHTYAAVSSGSTCSKLGATAVANKVKYECVLSGKKKIWKVVKPTKPSQLKLDDFSAFACNPNDPRLKNYKLPSGESLEIKAAAACLALAYIENPTSKSKINLSLSCLGNVISALVDGKPHIPCVL